MSILSDVVILYNEESQRGESSNVESLESKS